MTELLKVAIASGQVSAAEIEAHRVAGELHEIYASRIEKPQTLRETIDGASDEQAHVWCKVSDVRKVLDDVQVYRQAFVDALAAAAGSSK